MKLVFGPHTILDMLGSNVTLISSVPAEKEPTEPAAGSQAVGVVNPAVAVVVLVTGRFPTNVVSTRLISILYLSARVCSMLSASDPPPEAGTAKSAIVWVRRKNVFIRKLRASKRDSSSVRILGFAPKWNNGCHSKIIHCCGNFKNHKAAGYVSDFRPSA